MFSVLIEPMFGSLEELAAERRALDAREAAWLAKVAAYERSDDRRAEGFANAACALRHACRMNRMSTPDRALCVRGLIMPLSDSSVGDAMDERERAGVLANLARWDEAAPLHAQSDLYDLDGFRRGRDDIRPFELHEIGPIEGRELIHLQCHLGTDTLSWARHGAKVAGLDFSKNAIRIATELAADCRIDAEFWCADVYDAATAVQGRRFDIVYTGIGALGWLPDLSAWARVVADLLRPGGILYLVEIHPVVVGVVQDGRTITQDIFRAEFIEWDKTRGTYAAPEANFEHTRSFERVHSLSEVVTAILDAELTLELLHEQSYTNAPWPWTHRGDDGYHYLPDGWPRFPLTYSLRARLSD
jgi:2-polyprenyl-3-methyl-5-hydroxy-6-metoxy-1,4-benzoquinol methylase